MKFLLVAVHAKYIHMGLAVYSLRSYAGKELREHIELAEYTINQQAEDILADLYRRRPDAVGFSCYIWNVSCVTEVAREFHRLRPEVPVWVGGPEVSYDAGAFLAANEAVTGVMTGEGEQTFPELCSYYADGAPEPERIRGIVFRRNESIVRGRRPHWMIFRSAMTAFRDLKTESSITSRAAAARFHAVTVCPRWINVCVSGVSPW